MELTVTFHLHAARSTKLKKRAYGMVNHVVVYALTETEHCLFLVLFLFVSRPGN